MSFIFIDKDNSLAIQDVYEQRKIVSDIGGIWDPVSKLWRVTFTTYNLDFLLKNLDNVSVSSDMEKHIQKQKEKEAQLTRIQELSKQDVPVRFKIPGLKGSLYNYQKLGVMFAGTNGLGALLADEMGLGKGMVEGTKILTPNGYVKIESINKGDLVIGSNGKPTKVLGVFPQPIQDVFKITFSDGYSLTVDSNHLWHVYSDETDKVLSTQQLLDSKDKENYYRNNNGSYKWYIPLVAPVEFQTKKVDVCYYKFEGKRIPDEYKYSSITTRLGVLLSIIDSQKDSTSCVVRSKNICDDIVDIIQGLGGIALTKQTSKNKYKIEVKLPSVLRNFYNMYFFENDLVFYDKMPRRYIVNIEKQAEQNKTICISVDAVDKLYVAENCIVTHNTLQSIGTALYLKSKGLARNALVVTPASLKFNWPIEIEKFTDEKYVVIDGTPQERIAQWLRDDVFFTIVNYELILEDLFGGKQYKIKEDDTAEQRARKAKIMEKARQRERILTPIRTRMWDFIVADECFPHNTLIITNKGVFPIGYIVENCLDALVLSCDLSTNELSYKEITRRIKKSLVGNLVKVTHEYGKLICTANHKIWTEEYGYVRASELSKYENVCLRIVKIENNRCKEKQGFITSRLVGVKILEQRCYEKYGISDGEDTRVYNLEIKKNHNYIANGVLVSNCHLAKAHAAKRTRCLKQLRSKFRMALTGTPLDGRLEELHSVMGFVAPGLLGSKSRFFQRHVETDFWGKITGYKRLSEVTQRIQPYFIRRLKRDVLKDLPDKIYENKIVTLTAEERKIYKELASRGHEVTEDTQALVAIIRCKQFCNYPQMIDDTCKNSSKMETFKEVLNEVVILNGHKVVVFSQYKEMLDIIVKEIEGMGLKYLRIDGDTPKELRAKMQGQFNDDPKIDMMIGTEAMSMGLNFTGADYVINYDDNWSPSIMNQREDRCHRHGQKNTVTVVNFICKDTIEERIRDVIYGKNKITAEVLGDKTDGIILNRLDPQEVAKLL